MEVVNNANDVSRTQLTLSKNAVSLAYVDEESFPNISKKITEVPPTTSFNGSPSSQFHAIEVPQGNILYNGFFDLTITMPTLHASEINFPIGYNIIQRIRGEMDGQPLNEFTGEALRCMVANSHIPFQEFAYKNTLPLAQNTQLPLSGAAAAPITFTCKVPVQMSWFIDPTKAINTTKYNKIIFYVHYKDYISAGLSADPTALTCKFVSFKYRPDTLTLNKMISQDNTSNKLRRSFSTVVERVPILSSTTAEWQCQSTVPAYKTHVFIGKVNTNGNVPDGTTYGLRQVPIQYISVDAGGENYLNNVHRSVLEYEQAFNGMGNRIVKNTAGALSIEYNTNAPVVIDWSLLCDRDKNSGLFAFAGTNKPLITATFAPIIPQAGSNLADYYMFMIHEYEQIEESMAAEKILTIVSRT